MNICVHGFLRTGRCLQCENTPEASARNTEMEEAVLRTICHHPFGSDTIFSLLTGKPVTAPPPEPTEEQKLMSHDIVEGLLRLHYQTLNGAMQEVIGESLQDNPYI